MKTNFYFLKPLLSLIIIWSMSLQIQAAGNFDLYAIIGDDLVKIDRFTGAVIEDVAILNGIYDSFQNLVYNPKKDELLTIGNAYTDPTLLSINRHTGAIYEIGQIYPASSFAKVEAFAYNSNDGNYYISGTNSPSGTSDKIYQLNIQNAQATLIDQIAGTCDFGDVVQMLLVQGIMEK